MSTNYIAPIWRMPKNANNVANKVSNYSIEFSGTDYIEIADNILSGLANFSISVWYNADSLPVSPSPTPGNDKAILGAWSGSVTQMLLYWDDNTGWRFLMNNGTTTYAVTWGTAATINTWNHIAITYDGSTISFYHNNGTPVTNPGLGSVRTQSVPWRIGVDTSTTRYWDGKLGEFCLFDYALSEEQITYLYSLNDPMNISGTQPLAYLPLGDNSNPNDVATFPNTVFSNYSNYSFNFDGVARYSVQDNSVFSFGNGVDDEPFSISTWIKTTVGTNQGVISKYGGGALSEWILYVIGPNKIRLGLWDGSNTVYQLRTSTTSVNTGDWVHIVTTYDGRGGDGSAANTANQGIKIYIDGVEEVAYTDNFQNGYVAMEDTSYDVQIGAYASAAQFTGSISNTAIFDKELTGPEILDIYNSGTPNNLQEPSTYKNNIIAWWPMDENSSYFNGTTWVCRDLESSREAVGSNTSNPADMQGNAPGSTGNGLGVNIDIVDLKGNMKDSINNSYSINMADYGTPNSQGVTPASSGRTTSVPFP